MGVITGLRKYIFQEEVKYKAGISEITATKIGSAINFINEKQHSEKQFFINGAYGNLTPKLGVDGLVIFEFDAEIFNVYMFNNGVGSSGTTELDLKKSANPGDAFASIFSTTPKVTSAAAAYARIGVGGVLTGCTAPIFVGGVSAQVTAGTALRFDLISAMPGAVTTGLLVHYRPV